MHQILEKAQLSPNVTRLRVSAPRIAEIRRPGQFVIVRRASGAERIPLTIADADPGPARSRSSSRRSGRARPISSSWSRARPSSDVAGPLGSPTELIETGHAVCVGGGVGTAVILPIAQALQRRGVPVTSVIGGRSREWVILEDELRRLRRGRHVHRRRQLRAARLRDRGAEGSRWTRAASTSSTRSGRCPMMRAVAELTRPYGVHTIVSLNSIMVDGTGMCGGCRVSVGGETQLRLRRRPGVRRPPGRLPRARGPPDHLPTVRAGRAGASRRLPGRGASDDRPAGPGTPPRPEQEGADEDRAPAHARAGRSRSAATNFREVNLGLDRAAGPAGGRALPPVHEAQLHRRLPGPRQHPALHRAHRARRPAGRGGLAPRRQRAALRDRAASARRRRSARACASAPRPASPSRSGTSSASSPTGPAQHRRPARRACRAQPAEECRVIGSGPRRPDRGRRAGQARPRRSPSSRRSTPRAACSSTASRSSACPRTSSRPRSTGWSRQGVEIRAELDHRQDVHAARAAGAVRRGVHRRRAPASRSS